MYTKFISTVVHWFTKGFFIICDPNTQMLCNFRQKCRYFLHLKNLYIFYICNINVFLMFKKPIWLNEKICRM